MPEVPIIDISEELAAHIDISEIVDPDVDLNSIV